MGNILDYLFSAATFIPHGYCLAWRPDLVALHLVSDMLIFLAYFSIPVALVYFMRRRHDLRYRWMFGLFATFIFACGTTHILGALTLWRPYYGLEGLVKAMTATVSVATAILIWPLIPKALALPSPAHLADANSKLQAEMTEREAAEAELRRANAVMEERIEERTRALSDANAQLVHEIEERKRTQEHEALLAQELQHRVMNILAVVQSVAAQTLPKDEALDTYLGRVGALAKSQILLSEGEWSGVLIEDLLRQELAPYGVFGTEKLHVAGESLGLKAKAAQTLAMVFHELATNSVKYGALAQEEGRIGVSWEVAGSAIRVQWRETGGVPAPAAPRRSGFGSRLIERGIRHELDGAARLLFEDGGVLCEIEIPLVWRI